MNTNLDAYTIALENRQFQATFKARSHPFRSSVETEAAILLPDQVLARNELLTALKSNCRFILFTGSSGLGKTVILENALLLANDGHFDTIRIDSTEFSVDGKVADVFARVNDSPVRYIIDEAHNLSKTTLIEIEAFFNDLEHRHILFQAIYVARQYFLENIRHNELSDFNHFIDARITLLPLAESSMEQYMATRLNLAGLVSDDVITQKSIKLIIRASHGIPERLNVIASRAFRNASHRQHKRVEFNDAFLAINSPEMSPFDLSRTNKKHGKTILLLVGSVAVACSAVLYFGTPSLKSVLRQTSSLVTIATKETIDFFSDHTNEVSPQIPTNQATTPNNNYVEDPTQYNTGHKERTLLLAQLDKESRELQGLDTNNQTPVIKPRSIAPIPITPPPPQQHTTLVAPQHAQQDSFDVNPPIYVDDIVIADQQINNPLYSQPNIPEITPPTPPLRPTQQKQIIDIKPTKPVIVKTTTKSVIREQKTKIPEFCARMHPTTEAGLDYKRKVCVATNLKSDIYFAQ